MNRLPPLLALLAAAAPAAAQDSPATVPAATSPRATTPESDPTIIELTPFVVQATADDGYLATSTLAGTRLNTEIKDVGAAVSVYTEDFLKDIDGRKIEEILTYTTSTEGGGVAGNFAGFSGPNPDAVRDDPSGSNRVRSLANATRTRDYFASDIPSDSYNFSTVTVSRGPNAILAGIGEAGGVIDATMRQAGFNNRGSVLFRFGNNGSSRQEFHGNYEVIDDVFAVRVDAMNDNRAFVQEPAYEHDERVYAAATWRIRKPQPGAFLGSTTLRANGEAGSIYGVPPNNVPPVYSVQSWFEGIDPRDNLPWATPYWYHNGATRQIFNANGTVANNADLIQGFPLYRQWALVFADPTSNVPNVGLTTPGFEGIQGYVGTIPVGSGAPGGQLRGSGDQNRARFGYERRLLTNRDVFDFYENLLTGSLDYREQSFNSRDIRLEQLFMGGKAGVELAYNFERMERYRDFPISGPDAEIFIDVNRWLSVRNDAYGTTAPIAQQLIENPNFGRPFIVSRDVFRDQSNDSERESYQATAFLKQNFQESNSRWLRMLGTQTLSALAFQTEISRINRTYISTWDPNGPLNIVNHLAALPGTFGAQVNAFYYIGDSQLGAGTDNDVRLVPISSSDVAFGQGYTIRSFDTTTRRFVTGTSVPQRVLGVARDQREDVKSAAISWEGRWLQDHVITLLGVRRDEADAFTSIDPQRLPDGNLDMANFTLVPANSQAKNSVTKSIVAFVPRTIAEKLPFNSNVRIYWNESGNFSPVGQRRNQFNEELGSPTASTREFGIGVTMFKGRVDLRVNRFKTEIADLTVPGIGNAYNYTSAMIIRMLAARDAGLNPADYGYIHPSLTNFEDVARAFYESIPDRMKVNISEEANFNPRFITVNGVLNWENDAIVNKASISDSEASGTEIELIVNASRSWRISLSASRNEALRQDVAVDELEYAALWRANLERLYDGTLLRGSRNPSSGETLTFWPQYVAEHLAPIQVANAQSGSSTAEIRRWRSNLVTSYEIKNGFFKGLRGSMTARYQSKIGIGYPFIRDANNNQVADLSRPYWGPETLQFDFGAGYKRPIRIGGKRVEWNISMSVGNAIADDALIPISANADGSFGTVRIPPPRTWSITNSFAF